MLMPSTPRRATRAALTLVATAGVGIGLAQAAPAAPVASPSGLTTPSPDSQQDALVDFVMERDGSTKAQAEAYLEEKEDQQATLRSLEAKGVSTDGAFFKGSELVVVVGSEADASTVRAAGLTAKKGKGQSDLDRLSKGVLKAAGKSKHAIRTVGADLTTGTVEVRVAKDAPAGLVKKLKAMEGVTVTEGDELATHADVVPGRIMDLVPGTNCSLGYPGKTANGNNVLLTAGHCVEGLPDIYDASFNHIGKGTHSRFRTGSSSVDMGLMDIDAEDVGRPYVDGRNGNHYAVKGMSKGAIGSEICKAGNTTGWTCGYIKAYNRTVNYGGTLVSGLAEASVCSEGGDSGGAYLGAGNLAQGMTSGGPVGVDCGYNRGHAAGSYSFYQPVVDAARYYGVTIDTM